MAPAQPCQRVVVVHHMMERKGMAPGQQQRVMASFHMKANSPYHMAVAPCHTGGLAYCIEAPHNTAWRLGCMAAQTCHRNVVSCLEAADQELAQEDRNQVRRKNAPDLLQPGHASRQEAGTRRSRHAPKHEVACSALGRTPASVFGRGVVLEAHNRTSCHGCSPA